MAYFDWVKWSETSEPRLKAIFHPENERKTSPLAGVFRKRKGVRAGVFDIIGLIPEGKYHGFMIEMKIKPNKLTDNQKQWGKLLESLGYFVVVAYSATAAINFTKEYLKGNVCSTDSIN